MEEVATEVKGNDERKQRRRSDLEKRVWEQWCTNRGGQLKSRWRCTWFFTADQHYGLQYSPHEDKATQSKWGESDGVHNTTARHFVSNRSARTHPASTDFHCLPCIVVERLGLEFHLYRQRYTPFKCCYIVLSQLLVHQHIYIGAACVLGKCYGEGDVELCSRKVDLTMEGW